MNYLESCWQKNTQSDGQVMGEGGQRSDVLDAIQPLPGGTFKRRSHQEGISCRLVVFASHKKSAIWRVSGQVCGKRCKIGTFRRTVPGEES